MIYTNSTVRSCAPSVIVQLEAHSVVDLIVGECDVVLVDGVLNVV